MPNLESHLILRRCPHCNVDNPNLVEVARFRTTSHNGRNTRYWASYACNRCGGVTTAASYIPTGEIHLIFPSEKTVDEVIPNKAKAFLFQALDSIHAPSGAIMLAASSVDAMLKEKNYKQGSLYSRINQAAKDHLITDGMAAWAHEVRLDANDERHADEGAELPSESDAKKSVDFALALAQFLFVMPSRVENGINEAKGKK